ncbi:MerR family transcriptional regulator [Paenibacillus sp. GCM10012307]|uniref:MerR family transcriptional regulator n=1 Tax=Paenibacillus roseus TaxID=2798579 RepID=A0A934J2P5_9BACL|nr:MerR family transcriptional regulator [Paenibacillus roseus]MBJ6359751.1 MerR family transcriptional regulator [Paenibacillus roseus]
MNKRYTIGQAAEATGLSIHTLRYYEKEGILPFIKRTESGIRIFDDEDIQRIEFLNCLRNTGMPIHQLKEYVDLALQGDKTIDERVRMLENQKEKVEHEMNVLKSYIDMINYKTDLYSKLKNEMTKAHLQ